MTAGNAGTDPLAEARCGYAVVDADGEEQPCDRLATGWRWYQDCGHEDMLDVACDLHENEGGRRIHEADRLRNLLSDETTVEKVARAITGVPFDPDGDLMDDMARAALAAIAGLIEKEER